MTAVDATPPQQEPGEIHKTAQCHLTVQLAPKEREGHKREEKLEGGCIHIWFSKLGHIRTYIAMYIASVTPLAAPHTHYYI